MASRLSGRRIGKCHLSSNRFSKTRDLHHLNKANYYTEVLRNDEKIRASTHPRITGEEMSRSVYEILTIDRWESLNCMKYRTASLRPVHGRLALKFLKWFVRQPGLEISHITHLYCATTHILVRARMYDCVNSMLKHLSETGLGSSFVFDALMHTYPLCNSSPAVFDLLIRVYLRKGATDDAIETFHLMGFRGFRPSVYTCNMILAALAKVCSESVWLFFGEILTKGICPNIGTFNIVLNVLCREGKLKKASYLLKKMEESGYAPTVVSYNTVLNWYCKKGAHKEAMGLLDHMSCRGIKADVFTYNLLIDDLCKNNRSAKGYLLLKKMRKRMVIPTEVTYNTLINGFVKEGKIGVAEKVFDEMSMVNVSPNCITYNALIDGHSCEGSFVKAFELLNKMVAKGLMPNAVTYGALMNGLCKHGKLDSAKDLLARIKEDGLTVNLSMYTMLMDGLCGSGKLGESMGFLDKMFEENMGPDIVTYSVLVNGFCRAGKINRAKEIICKIVRSGIRLNRIVYSTLIYNLCRHGDIKEAIKVYSSLLHSGHCPDMFICNVVLSAICRSGNVVEAEDFMHHIHRIGLSSSSVTFDAIISSCVNVGNVPKASEFFNEMVKSGYQPSFYTYGSLLKGLCKGGNLGEAVDFFSKLRRIPCALDTYTYNIMLSEICKHGELKLALTFLGEMVQTGVFPDSYTYGCLIAGLCRAGKVVTAILLLERGQQRGTISPNQFMYSSIISGLTKIGHARAGIYFFDDIVRQGLNPDIVTLNAVIDACSRVGLLDKLKKVLSMMETNSLSPSLATYNILLHRESASKNVWGCFTLYKNILRNGYVPDKLTCHSLILGLCKSSMQELGVKFLKMIIIKGTIADESTFTLLIDTYSQRGDISKAFDLLNIMKSLGISPNQDTFSSLFYGLKRVSGFHEARVLLHEMMKSGFVPTIQQYCRLIKSMCKSGDIAGALQVRDEMEALDVSSHDVAESAIVRGLVQCGKTEEAVLIVKFMLRGKIVPTVATFTTLIHALCNKGSKLSEALDLKLAMERHGAKPDVVTYNVLLTGLCRNYDFALVYSLYEEMKQRNIFPNFTTFYVLISTVWADKNSAKGESILKDLEERGLVSKDSIAQSLDRRLNDALVNINRRRRKRETGGDEKISKHRRSG